MKTWVPSPEISLNRSILAIRFNLNSKQARNYATFQKDIREMLGLKEPSFPRSNFSAPVSFYSLPDLTSLDAYFTTNHAARRLSPIDFKQFRYSLDINMDPRTSTNAITSTSKITNDIDPEIQVSSNTPLLGHHRRKSSSMRTVSSFIDYRDS